MSVQDGMRTGGGRAESAQRIARPALAQGIARALDRGSVLLVAGPGYGKSTVLEESISAGGRRSVWLSCADADREPGRLLLNAVQGLREAIPGLADVVGERLAAGVELVDASAAARALRRELEGLLVEPLVIVFDDAEDLADSEVSLGWISQLLEIGGVPLSVAMASRRTLPLKLAKLRAADRIQEFGATDLSFSATECEQVLRLWAGRAVYADVEAVMKATEGWPLGVALAGLARRGQVPDAAVPRTDVFRYLAEEVLERLEPEFMAAVIDSSVPPVLTPELCQALALPADFLERVERSGLFVRPQVDGAGARSYHPLFREFLLERLVEERGEEDRRGLHATVAAGLASGGRTAEAIDHWLEAGRPTEALSALASAGQELVRTSPETVSELLSRLPADLRQTPSYLLLEGQLEWNAGRHEEALAPLRSAVLGFRDAGDQEREWLTRHFLVDALTSVGEFDEVVEEAADWDGQHPPGTATSAIAVAWYRVLALALAGHTDAARELADVLHRDPETARRFRYLENVALLASDLPAGRAQAAIERLQATIRELELDDPGGRLPYAFAGLVAAYLDVGRLETASEFLDRYLWESERAGLGFVARDAHLQRAFLLAQQGDLSAAELELAQAGARRGTGWRGLNRPKAEAQVASLRGDHAEAVAAAERALSRSKPGPLFFRIAVAVDMAPVLAENGAPEVARGSVTDVLSALDDQFPGERGRYHRARLLATQASLDFEAGDVGSSYSSLRRAWKNAGAAVDGLIRAQWSGLRPVVWQALADGEIDPGPVLPALESAFAGGSALIGLTEHPEPAVRRSAISAALASSHPLVLSRLGELEEDADVNVASAAVAARERLRREPPPLRFELLGGFRAIRAGWEIEEAAWERPMAARVVRFLLVSGPGAVTEDALFEAFWSERSTDLARQHLAVALSRARKVLDLRGAERSIVEASERTYALRLRPQDTVDSRDFETAAVAALGEAGSSRRISLERTAELWMGEPLPEDRYSPWTFAWRDRLTELYAGVLTALVELYADLDDQHASIRTAKRLLELDSSNEEAHRRLMISYARTGRTNYALRQYLECRRALVSELGVEPSASTSRLQARILAGESI